MARYLNASAVRDDLLNESTELKAIRESILRVRMSDWLQFPGEAPWLESVIEVFMRVLKRLWVSNTNLSDVTVRSNWLVDQINMLGWAHALGAENGDNVVKIGRGLHILMLLTPPENVSQEVKEAYWAWIEPRLLAPIREQFPELFAWMIDYQRSLIAKIAESKLNEE